MTINPFCKYHPSKSAHWYCKNCDVHFCMNCVPENNKDLYPPCTLCRRSLTSLSIAESIPPFWTKTNYFFRFPLQRNLILFAVIIAFIKAVFHDVRMANIVSILLLMPTLEILFALMEKVACGEGGIIDLSVLKRSNGHHFYFKSAAILAIASLLISKLGLLFGSSVAYVFAIFLVMAIPASLIILMMEKRIFSSLNPNKIVYLVKVFGASYFLVYLIAGITAWLSFKLVQLSLSSGGVFLATFLSSVLILYLMMVLFAMMGYLVFQHHYELNYNLRSSDLSSLRESKQAPMIEIDIFIQEGRFEDAQKLLLEAISKNEIDVRANEKLIYLYQYRGRKAQMDVIAEQYFNALVANRKASQAADFYCKMREKAIESYPKEIATIKSMVLSMKNTRQYKFAIDLLRKSDITPANTRNWDEMELILIELLINYEENYQEADSLISHVLKRSVNQERLDRAEQFANMITNIR